MGITWVYHQQNQNQHQTRQSIYHNRIIQTKQHQLTKRH